MVWIKICGITNMEDAESIYRIGPDVMGFVFYKNSPRKISVKDASAISESIGKKRKEDTGRNIICSLSGVFVNEDPGRVIETAGILDLEYIQFSGDEDTGYLQGIKKNISGTGLKTIKSVKIGKKVDELNRKAIFEEITSVARLVDYVLLDYRDEKSFGGTGRTFNWEAVKDIGLFFPVILSGGLDSGNIVSAMEMLKPSAVDASSRLESAPGKKDITRVRLFIETVRKWNKDEK